MEHWDLFESHPFEDIYSLDVIHSIACLQESVESSLRSAHMTLEELETIKEQAQEVVDIASRLQTHYPPFSNEYKVLNGLKDKVFSKVVMPLEGILMSKGMSLEQNDLWKSIEEAFYGPHSLTSEVGHLERFVRDVL